MLRDCGLSKQPITFICAVESATSIKLLQSHASAGDPRLLGREGALADAYRIVLGALEGSALACTLRVRNSGGGGGRASHVLECHCNAAERLSGGDLYLLNCLRRCALPMLAQAERRPQLRGDRNRRHRGEGGERERPYAAKTERKRGKVYGRVARPDDRSGARMNIEVVRVHF